jgi:hypothetical protein
MVKDFFLFFFGLSLYIQMCCCTARSVIDSSWLNRRHTAVCVPVVVVEGIDMKNKGEQLSPRVGLCGVVELVA